MTGSPDTRLAIIFALLTMALSICAANGDVRTHPLISDGAVLQRGKRVPIWGTADEGEKVTVQFQNQTVSTIAHNGSWTVILKRLKPGGPFTMTINGKNSIKLSNILVGEVWLCSGQSNMQWSVSLSANPQEVIANSSDSQLRLITIPRTASDVALHEISAKWQECGPTTVPEFSAVAYFFGRALRKSLRVPVGLINSSVGGTPAEAWTSRQTLEATAQLRTILDAHANAVARYPQLAAAYEEAKKKHAEESQKAIQEGKTLPRPPVAPGDPSKSFQRPTGLYNAMIVPLQPYAIRGAIWYQGESNAGKAYQYRTLFAEMIRNWRQDWHNDFPFLFVQLAPFLKIESEPKESAWAELREAQLLTMRNVPRTAMAVITDAGDEVDIHPKMKPPVGERLALAARAIAYGEKITYSGPIYDSMKVEGNKVVLFFKHVGTGLVVKGEELKGFAIAGEDKKFMNAHAEVSGNKVLVWSPDVPHPVAIRYGWANYPTGNLYNKEGLPASPFRTDDFPGITR